MRCLQHVLWRGGLALGLLVSGGTGAMLMPQPEAPTCQAATHAPRSADAIEAPLALEMDHAGNASTIEVSINAPRLAGRASS